ARTLHGMLINGFPNCFIFSKAQSGVHVNVTHVLSEQSKHMAYIVGRVLAEGASVVEASAEAEDDWVDRIRSLALKNLDFLEACTPGLFNNEGDPSGLKMLNSPYGGGALEWLRILEKWREEGSMHGLIMSKSAGTAVSAEPEQWIPASAAVGDRSTPA